MAERGFWDLGVLSDERLISDLNKLLTAEARTEARLVAHLAEIDARKLTLFSGMSLFEYCTTSLKLGEHAAYLRITAARAGRRFPLIFQMLEKREVHLSSIAILSKHLTLENHVEVLNEARGLTKRELLRMMARRWPQAVAASKLRRLPIPLDSVPAGPTGSMTFVQEFTHRLELFLSTEQYQKVELARDLTMHSNPTGDLAVMIERALDLLIGQQKRRQYGSKAKASSAPPPAAASRQQVKHQPSSVRTESRAAVEAADAANDVADGPALRKTRRHHIPNSVRRQVYERDGRRCTFIGNDGHRCESRKFLQFHHDRAWAKDGPNTVENLRLLCSTHNQLLAEQEFGAREATPDG